MVLRASLSLKPVWGWGWIDCATDQTIEPPEALQLGNVEIARTGRFRAVGQVGHSGHILNGLWIRLQQRHNEGSSAFCDLSAHHLRPSIDDESPAEPVIYGYVEAWEPRN